MTMLQELLCSFMKMKCTNKRNLGLGMWSILKVPVYHVQSLRLGYQYCINLDLSVIPALGQ